MKKKTPPGKSLKPKTRRSPQTRRQIIPTPQKFLKAGDGQLSSVEKYCWQAYGRCAFIYELAIDLAVGNAQMIVDTEQFQICEMHAVDNSEPESKQAFRWTNPAYRNKHLRECRNKGFSDLYAWDDVRWVSVPPQHIMARVKKLIKKTRDLRKKNKNPPGQA